LLGNLHIYSFRDYMFTRSKCGSVIINLNLIQDIGFMKHLKVFHQCLVLVWLLPQMSTVMKMTPN